MWCHHLLRITCAIPTAWTCSTHLQLQGLVFVSNQRAGALAGYSWGRGVLIARLPGGWSAPLLLRQRSGSLGLLLGWQRIEACHVLQVGWAGWEWGMAAGQGLGCSGTAAACRAGAFLHWWHWHQAFTCTRASLSTRLQTDEQVQAFAGSCGMELGAEGPGASHAPK